MRRSKKIAVIGAGFVGSAVTFSLMESGLASDIVLVDRDLDKAQGEALDIAHGAAFVQAVEVVAGDYAAIAGADLVVITAGASQKEGETRLDLNERNVRIFMEIIPRVVRYAPQAVLLVVSNPVDVLSYVSWRLSGLPAHQVIGSGTVLDSSRLRYALARRFEVDARSIHAHIAGEHGDSEFPLWSAAMIGSLDLIDYCEREGIDYDRLTEEVAAEVRDSAYEIIRRKGYTNYAIALAVRRIARAVLRDENAVLSISSLDARAGVYYSVPTIVGGHGCVATLLPRMTEHEQRRYEQTREVLRGYVEHADRILGS